MTMRERLIDYIKHGGDQFLCSIQIGAGAGFDTKMVGKEWISQTTLEDLRDTVKKFDMVPLFNISLPELADHTATMHWENSEPVFQDGRWLTESKLVTPKGCLTKKTMEEPKQGVFQTKFPVTEPEELDILEYYVDSLLELSDYGFVTKHVRDSKKILGEDIALDVQWPMQPYEMLCFLDTMNTAIFAMEEPEQFKRLMDKILRLDEKLIHAVAAGGGDFVFLGGPGSEMISPAYYEAYLVPYSKLVSEMVHHEGMLIYSHICSPIEPMLSKGYYNEMGIDLFETLSEAPVGNVRSIEDAFSKLSPDLCTRGNIGLDHLLQDTPEQIKALAFHMMEQARAMSRKHIVAASDYLFYGIPEENVHAICEAVREFNGAR